ncbi:MULTISPECIES: porin [unclassified Halomonas]|uniref:porin n=1 Tax=unclassified Halomonas TaxID=2609666 RepID=UPI0007D8F4ED|nr:MULTISPECIES: porin [unclassified Halomonas]MBT2787298.1 porin [Halomonas sp. ISL-106]MBT2796338.1 porin [Halomonas sp. ISL-104]OAL57513.1 porin [Halomonas sp. ALS9]
MQKKQLAVAVASLLSISSAQATTLYDQDGTKLDIYGRISMGIAGGGPEFNSAGNKVNDGAEFVDVYSRLGFRMSHKVTSDLNAFGHLEWRFTGDERNTNQGFNEIRQSYIGLASKQYGTLLAGNFNSMYSQFVSMPFDVYQDRGLLFKSSGLQSWGDSLAYYTPELNGFTSFLQVKHYSERGLTAAEQSSEGDVTAAQGGVQYQQGALKVGFGAVENVVRGGGSANGEMLYGLIGSYSLSDQLSMRLGIETQDNSDTYGGGFETVGLGGTYSTGPWAFTADYYNVDRDDGEESNAWAAGAYYKISSAFDVFVELADGDAPSMRKESTADRTYWLTGARYHF